MSMLNAFHGLFRYFSEHICQRKRHCGHHELTGSVLNSFVGTF